MGPGCDQNGLDAPEEQAAARLLIHVNRWDSEAALRVHWRTEGDCCALPRTKLHSSICSDSIQQAEVPGSAAHRESSASMAACGSVN